MAKVLVVGSGGREHALAWKLSQSPEVEKVYVAPGNGGTALEFENVSIKADNIDALAEFAETKEIDLTVVGPEDPLAMGIVDYFQNKRLRIFGPTKHAAQIEANKLFAKSLMANAGIPTAGASYSSSGLGYYNYRRLAEEILAGQVGVVIKYPYLAAGKGVFVCNSEEEIKQALDDILTKQKFGTTDQVLIEQRLIGEEASFLAFVDGETVMPLLPSQDHKPVYDKDKGPNTGGMGAYAPAPIVTEEMQNEITEKIMKPTVNAMSEKGIVYKGLLYAGLMITKEGPKVLEFNCRFGDPETQPLMMLLKSDLYKVMNATIDGKLDSLGELRWHPAHACCVVMTSKGYPGDYEKGNVIAGDILANSSMVKVFHAGTKLDDEVLVTSGGRVLGVTGVGADLATAKNRAYDGVRRIGFEGAYYRTDIGAKGLKGGTK